MAKRKKPHDQHASREAGRYDNPIASRELILEVLDMAAEPVFLEQLAHELQLNKKTEKEALERRVSAMLRDGQLDRQEDGRLARVSESELIRGRVQVHRDGFGFLIPDAGGKDFYLHNKQLTSVFDGDIVLARSGGPGYKGLSEARIVEIVERKTNRLVGRYTTDRGLAQVQPDNPRIQHLIEVDQENSPSANFGDYVVVEITRFPDSHTTARGKIVEVLGDHLTPGIETEIAIRSYDIPHEWPEDLLAYTKTLPEEPLEEDKLARVDLRDKPFVTIDGEDARDFDDAVYCEKKASGDWRVFVAIADVSFYVQVDSLLDREATIRGTSVYFPDRVVPMLPEQISNGLCSLKPDVDRLCLVCEMTVSATGKLTDYSFFEGVIHSQARLTYSQAWRMIEEEADQQLREHYSHVTDSLDQLHALYKVLRKARTRRGAIDFETVETRMIFNEEGKIDAIVPVIRNDAHKLIEECMLLANVATANFLSENKVPALYRVHQGPTEEKLENLRDYLGELGLGLSGGENPAPSDYGKLINSIQDRPDANVIQTMLLRSMSQAVYQPVNEGHFGLAYHAYTHFTSPIRRYPDLLVHRAIRSLIRSGKAINNIQRAEGTRKDQQKTYYPYDFNQMLVFGEHCSMTERRADEASRDVVNWLKCEFLSEHVGDVFEGTIAAVTGFGLFVEMDDIYIEGLVHVTAMDQDFYNFDKAKQRLIGERSRKTYQLGDRITMQVARVDMDEKKIDLVPAGSGKKPSRKSDRATEPRKPYRRGNGKNDSGEKRKTRHKNKSSAEKSKTNKTAKKKPASKKSADKNKPAGASKKKHQKRVKASSGSNKTAKTRSSKVKKASDKNKLVWKKKK